MNLFGFLDTTPPKKQVKDMSQDFYSAGFAPGAIVYFSYDLPMGNCFIPLIFKVSFGSSQELIVFVPYPYSVCTLVLRPSFSYQNKYTCYQLFPRNSKAYVVGCTGDDSANANLGSFLQDDILSLNGLDLIQEEVKQVESAPEPVVEQPTPNAQEVTPSEKKPIKPKWFKR